MNGDGHCGEGKGKAQFVAYFAGFGKSYDCWNFLLCGKHNVCDYTRRNDGPIGIPPNRQCSSLVPHTYSFPVPQKTRLTELQRFFESRRSVGLMAYGSNGQTPENAPLNRLFEQ